MSKAFEMCQSASYTYKPFEMTQAEPKHYKTMPLIHEVLFGVFHIWLHMHRDNTWELGWGWSQVYPPNLFAISLRTPWALELDRPALILLTPPLLPHHLFFPALHSLSPSIPLGDEGS